ncbi:MAG: hypothetical protein ACYSRP_06290 [Planctomycetota bacterium]|jgi:hypothetical protein
MFRLEGRGAYYPNMSVKRTTIWDQDRSRLGNFYGKNADGWKGKVTVGFTPPIYPIKKRKNLEFQAGFQWLDFQQHDGYYRIDNTVTNTSGGEPAPAWDRARSWRYGFFVGGTLRW